MHHVDAGHRLEQLAGKMRHRAHARGAVAVLAGVGLQQRDELTQILCRQLRVGDQHQRKAAGERDRDEVLDRIVWQVLVDEGVDHGRGHRLEDQRVAVGPRPGDRVGGDGAAGAALVLHHHLLAELVAEMLGGQARHHVDAAPRGQRNDELDRPVRPGFLRRERPARRGDQRERAETTRQETARQQRARSVIRLHRLPPGRRGRFVGPPSCAAIVVTEACAKCLPGVRALATIVAGKRP